jgi:hypothetical protein
VAADGSGWSGDDVSWTTAAAPGKNVWILAGAGEGVGWGAVGRGLSRAGVRVAGGVDVGTVAGGHWARWPGSG